MFVYVQERATFNENDSQEDGDDPDEEVNFILSDGKSIEEKAMTVKRAADDQPLPKNPRNEGDGRVPMGDILNPSQSPLSEKKRKKRKQRRRRLKVRKL